MAAAAFGGRVILSSLLTEFVDPCLPEAQQKLYRYQTHTEGRVVACRDCCGLLADIFARICDGNSKN
jgi:hypothetical protein